MIVLNLAKTFPIRITDWLLASMMIAWGIACWNLSSDQWIEIHYAGLARLGDQHEWGGIVFILGVLRMICLFRNGGWRPSPHLRALFAFLSCFVWLQITLGLFYSEMPTLGIAIYPWLLAADIYNVFRASHDARTSDDRFRFMQAAADEGRQESATPTGH